jgi:RHS repeat-associated protein
MKTMSKMSARLGAVLAGLALLLSGVAAQAGTITYFHNDLAGSPLVATNEQGQVVWRESYRPYGERLVNSAAASGNAVWFTSRRQDAESGLVYMGARHYDPVAGRFVSMDPVGFDEGNLHSFNRYAYANNNPYRYKDPDGRAAETIFDVISFGISVEMFRRDPSLGNFLGAAVDGLAVAIPFVPGGVGSIRALAKGAEVAHEVTLLRSLHGEAAQHADDAIRSGKPDVLTIDRSGAQSNRQASTGTVDKVSGKHLDEYPPAMFKEGGAGASVRAISPRDNMSAGACIGNACRGLPDGTRVRIKIGD